MKLLGIRPTKRRRGKRGGQRKQRQIKVITNLFQPLIQPRLKNRVNQNDLIQAHPTKPSLALKVALLNAQSIRNKTEDVVDLIEDDNIDMSEASFTAD